LLFNLISYENEFESKNSILIQASMIIMYEFELNYSIHQYYSKLNPYSDLSGYYVRIWIKLSNSFILFKIQSLFRFQWI